MSNFYRNWCCVSVMSHLLTAALLLSQAFMFYDIKSELRHYKEHTAVLESEVIKCKGVGRWQ